MRCFVLSLVHLLLRLACALAGAFACLLLGLDLTPQQRNRKTVRTTRKESRVFCLFALSFDHVLDV
jgi:hypothetical protein